MRCEKTIYSLDKAHTRNFILEKKKTLFKVQKPFSQLCQRKGMNLNINLSRLIFFLTVSLFSFEISSTTLVCILANRYFGSIKTITIIFLNRRRYNDSIKRYRHEAIYQTIWIILTTDSSMR